MVRCDKCTRSNPPNRSNCLYCDAALTALPSASSALTRLSPSLKPIETGEQGFNCIFVPVQEGELTEAAITRMAFCLRLEREHCSRILNAGVPLPVARVAEEKDATLIREALGELGCSVLVVTDAELSIESVPQKRARAMDFNERSVAVSLAGTDKKLSFAWEEVVLMVTGRIRTSHVEQKQRRGRGNTNQVVETRETSSDESVIDVYTKLYETSWRVSAESFDFSCLGKAMSLIAGQNLPLVAMEMRRLALNAVYDDSYDRLRKALSPVWPSELRKEARGWHRAGAGRFNTETVNINNNQTQFARYSRLQHYLRVHIDSRTT